MIARIGRPVVVTLALVALTVGAPPRPTDACCMVPVTWNGDVDQAEQNVVVFHHAGHEELVLRVAPFFQKKDGTPFDPVGDKVAAAAAETAPPYLEWVVTVPSTPTGYHTVAPTVFRDADGLAKRLTELAEKQYAARTRWEWPDFRGMGSAGDTRIMAPTASAGAAHGLDIAEPVRVGPYEITAVKARGREALDELNAYLGGRGFPQEDPDHMAWFVDRKFTFLCIHVTPPAGSARLGKKLDLEPLQIGFATERPYYPAKFSSRQGAFAVSLSVISSAPIAHESRQAVEQRLRAETPKYTNTWTEKTLSGALADVAKSAWAGGVQRWHVNAFRSYGFNFLLADGKPTISTWKDDVSFDLGGDADEMPGWYYGDRDIGAPERIAREHGVAVGVWSGLAGLLFVGLWRRRRRTVAR